MSVPPSPSTPASTPSSFTSAPRPDMPDMPADALAELVASIDEALQGSPSSVLIRLTAISPEVEIGLRDLPAWESPHDALVGFTAPASWLALGLHCHGRAYRFPPASDPDQLRPGDGSLNGTSAGSDLGSDLNLGSSVGQPSPYSFCRSEATEQTSVSFTTLLGRDGQGAAVMREGSKITALRLSPDGVLGDCCRRALGLPTSPPPPSSVELWLRVWLDRLIDAVAFLGSDRYQTWDSVLATHPIVTSEPRSAHVLVSGPVALADATCRLAEAWPWDRLKGEPDIVEVPQPPPSQEITDWMDDGMYARWTLSTLPSIDELAGAIRNTLPSDVARQIGETVTAAGLLWPD